MEVFEEYAEESILKDAMDELKTIGDETTAQGLCKDPHDYESLSVLDSVSELDQLLDISQIEQFYAEKKEPENTRTMFEADNIFLESIIDGDSKLFSYSNEASNNQSISTDCFDASCVFSDTTEVITSSDLLGELMSKSGILINATGDNAKEASVSKKRKSSSDTVVCEKLQKLSETDADDCYSVYSSCASSPEDRCAIRRQKNNEASKISRANRKVKQQKLFEREKELEKENKRLQKLINEMTSEAEELRKILVEKLSSVKCFGN